MFDTYVLTNEHVVDNLISVQEKWSTLLQKMTKVDTLGHPDVEVFSFAYQTRVQGASSLQADIMAYDKDEDMALLRVRSGMQFKHVAQYGMQIGEVDALARWTIEITQTLEDVGNARDFCRRNF